MRLRALTGLERDKLKDEYAELKKLIDYLNSILNDEVLRYKIIKDEITGEMGGSTDPVRTHG